MSKQTPISKPLYSLLPTDVQGFDSLAEMAAHMRWSWNHATDDVWRQLDPALWEFTQNPWVACKPSRGQFSSAHRATPPSARRSMRSCKPAVRL